MEEQICIFCVEWLKVYTLSYFTITSELGSPRMRELIKKGKKEEEGEPKQKRMMNERIERG